MLAAQKEHAQLGPGVRRGPRLIELESHRLEWLAEKRAKALGVPLPSRPTQATQNVPSLIRRYAGDFGLRTLTQLLHGPDL